jgi:hypothetical protein
MNIKTVGERVRLVAAIKALRQECYLAASLAARTPIRVTNPPPLYTVFFLIIIFSHQRDKHKKK